MNEKAISPETKALELAAKYICNQQDGRCPMVVDNYRCLSACAQDTQPWRCWIDHFLVASGTHAAKAAKEAAVRDFSRRSQPGPDRRGNVRPAANLDG